MRCRFTIIDPTRFRPMSLSVTGTLSVQLPPSTKCVRLSPQLLPRASLFVFRVFVISDIDSVESRLSVVCHSSPHGTAKGVPVLLDDEKTMWYSSLLFLAFC